MPDPLLIVISGLPCSGKTTLGWRIAEAFSLPFIHKDGIKESLFDSLGWKDRAWSKQLSWASYELLLYFAAAVLRAGRSGIVEGNFPASVYRERFMELKRLYPYEPVEILCSATGEVLYQRFKARQRHPGHVDSEALPGLQEDLLKGKTEPLRLGGTLLEVDTTDVEKIDYDGLLQVIQVRLNYGLA